MNECLTVLPACLQIAGAARHVFALLCYPTVLHKALLIRDSFASASLDVASFDLAHPSGLRAK